MKTVRDLEAEYELLMSKKNEYIKEATKKIREFDDELLRLQGAYKVLSENSTDKKENKPKKKRAVS
jgi:hypothetical protein